MGQIIFEDLNRWYSKYTDHPEEMVETTRRLWEKFHLFPKQCKQAIDEISHPNLVPSSDEVTQKCKRELEQISKKFGLFSPVYQSITKMIIDCELNSNDIKKHVKEIGILPAAFNQTIIAHPSYDMFPIVDFVNDIFDREYESDPSYWCRYTNVENLREFARQKSRRFFQNLGDKRRLVKLSNGSGTRIEDVVNIQDINGSIYMTMEEADLISSMKDLLDWLHIDNFKEEFQFLETIQVSNTYGSVNYAPDDSGKTRISFMIDSCVQIVSKAFHEYLDYLVKDLSCNGTYRQQSVIRNMINHERHIRPGVILSTDMSKYSDTLQRRDMLQILSWIGVPDRVTKCLDTLYSLPLWDSVLRKNTGSTSASYQGQYGDFPWITLVNIFNQLASYDYINFTYGTKYIIDLKMKPVGKSLVCRNDMNCAVGDDTIMAFPGWKRSAEDLFYIVKAVFNRAGVNINLSKTHWIQNGEGCCDFVKRFITKDGLVPYLRIQSAVSTDYDERCEEMLRFYRDNMLTLEEWSDVVTKFLPPEYSNPLIQLHVLNGGVVDRPISKEDLQLFYYKNMVYSKAQSLKNKDEIRKWIEVLHTNYDVKLLDTHLIAFLVDEICPSPIEDVTEVLWDSEGMDEEIDWSREIKEMTCELDDKRKIEYHSWEEVRKSFSEEELVTALLNIKTKGYKFPDFENIHRLEGEFLATALEKYDDFRQFFYDYQQGEIYRYLYSNQSHQLKVYTEMFCSDHTGILERDNIYRYPFMRGVSNSGSQLLTILIKRAIEERAAYCQTHWGIDHWYIDYKGNRYRLYPAKCTKYELPPKSVFIYLLGYHEQNMSSERKENLDNLWEEFCSYMNL